MKGPFSAEWSRLVAFPVFFAGVMVAGRIANKQSGAVLAVLAPGLAVLLVFMWERKG